MSLFSFFVILFVISNGIPPPKCYPDGSSCPTSSAVSAGFRCCGVCIMNGSNGAKICATRSYGAK